MKTSRISLALLLVCSILFAAGPCRAEADTDSHPLCPLCGMDRKTYAHSRILLQFDNGSAIGTCSIHCAAIELALNREKIVTDFHAADYNTKKLIDGKKAFWVIGGNRPGVMTGRAKWAFEKREGAEGFARRYGGMISSFDDAMQATFQDMYEDVKLIRQRKARYSETRQDVKDHPDCKYCGMKRELFAYSRMLIKYGSGPATGTCSIHCASIDLALNTDRMPDAILVGDYNTKRLIDAEKAVWVVGGKKPGVMTIRGKWAFEDGRYADAFIRENGGKRSTFDESMKAAFEDFHEMLR